jgi:hypothetical protein
MLKLTKIYINFMKKEINIGICSVISKLVEKRKQLEKVGDVYYGMELVIRKKLKYVGLKMCNFFNKYL